MIAPGNFIDAYRIIVPLGQTRLSYYYFVEHTTNSTGPLILNYWSGINLDTEQQQNEFRSRTKGSTITQGTQTITIQDANIHEQHPYLVAPYNAEILQGLQNHNQNIEQNLSTLTTPDNPNAIIDTFLRSIVAEAAIPAQADTVINPVSSASGQEWNRWNTYNDPTVRVTPPVPPVSSSANEPTVRDTSSAGQYPGSPYSEPTVRDTSSAGYNPSSPYSEPTVRDTTLPAYNSGVAYQANNQYAQYSQPTQSTAKIARQKGLRSWQKIALAIVLLLLIIGGGGWLYTIIPASAATITITPQVQRLKQSYTIKVGTQADEPNKIQGRTVSFSTPPQTKTASATGRGHKDAVAATGKVTFSQIHFYSTAASHSIKASIIHSLSGVAILISAITDAPEGGSVTVDAQANDAGAGGNIPAHDMDGPVDIINTLTSVTDGTAYLSNDNAFSGGQNAYDYNYIQQSDIDGLINPLETQLRSDAQNNVQSQLQNGEHVVNDWSCNTDKSNDHNANDQADQVTVTVKVTCSGLVYSEQAMHDASVKAYTDAAHKKFGDAYSTLGEMKIGEPAFNITEDGGTGLYNVDADGYWTYQYTASRKLDLAKTITGKSQSIVNDLLQKRHDIAKVSITTSGLPGNALPSDPKAVQIEIVPVKAPNS